MSITSESIQDQIPYYLTQESKNNLVSALRTFPDQINYYVNLTSTKILQGDSWTSVEVRNFATGERKLVKGILLSNTCDVAPENVHMLAPNLIFSPIIRLNQYLNRLQAAGANSQQLQDKATAIRNQEVTTIFYLPQGAGLEEEYIAILSDVHTVPYPSFNSISNKQKLSTLSQIGFYLYILKLSMHFCRFQEGVDRS